jgi:hypothetical protein
VIHDKIIDDNDFVFAFSEVLGVSEFQDGTSYVGVELTKLSYELPAERNELPGTVPGIGYLSASYPRAICNSCL